MTYSIFLGLALGLAAAGFLVRRRSETAGNALMVLGGLGCAGCIAWQVRQTMFTPAAPGPDRGQAVVSYFLANAVLKEVGNRQGAVVLFFPPASVFDEDTVGTYVGTFSRVLRGWPLKVEVLILEAPSKAAKAGRFSLAEFQKAAAKIPAPVACVSFAGIPPDIEKFSGTDAGQALGFYVFDPWGTTNWLGGLRKKFVRAAVVMRPEMRGRATEDMAGEPGELFQQLYLMATPATADEVARQLGAK